MKKQSSSSCELGWLLTFLQGMITPEKTPSSSSFELVLLPVFWGVYGPWAKWEVLSVSIWWNFTVFQALGVAWEKTKVSNLASCHNCDTCGGSSLAWETGKFRQIRSGKTSRFSQAMYTPQKTESWTRVEVPCPSSFLGLPQGLTRSSSLSF